MRLPVAHRRLPTLLRRSWLPQLDGGYPSQAVIRLHGRFGSRVGL